MREDVINRVVCPKCKLPLTASRMRHFKGVVLCGTLTCLSCREKYPIMAGVPSLFLNAHSFPIGFLPPEDILPEPVATLKEKRLTNSLALVLKKYGKAQFMRAVRQTAKLSTGQRQRRIHVSPSSVMSQTIKRKAYRFSKESFVRKVMEPVMRKRFWPDKRCIAMVETLQKLYPDSLLDIATGPGGLLCRALPLLKRTTAIGLEIYFDKCRLVLSEAVHFGFRDRIEMIHGDARLMPFPDSSFDCVSGWTAAYHISWYEEALRESARVLRTGGHFVGTFHTIYPSHCTDVLTREEEEEFIRCAHLPMNIHEVCDVLRASGFAVAKKTEVGNSHLIVARKK